MQLDFSALVPSLIVAVIGWLIRNTFKSFGDKLDKIAEDVHGVKAVQVDDGNRITALETVVEGWHPLRRRTDTPA